MKSLIFFKKFFSVLAAIVVAIFMYLNIDGYNYKLWEIIFSSIFMLLIWIVWNRRLYDALVNEKSEKFKNSEINQMYYFLFEFFGFLMVFFISVFIGYDVVLFLFKSY